MKVIRGIENWKENTDYPVVTMGNFDGVHLGHQKVLHSIVQSASAQQGESVALTFSPHPLKVISPAKAPPLITTCEQKIHLIEKRGVDYLLIIPFDERLHNLKPEEFVKEVLVEGLKVREVHEGPDFTFGRGRKGTMETLRQLGQRYGFQVKEVDFFMIDGAEVSSTLVRDLIQRSEMKKVAQVLGRPYSVEGKVIHGKSRGKQLGFPTANLQPKNELLPPRGVYAVKVLLKGSLYPGAANIGINPTFHDPKETTLEVHLLDFEQGLYGEELEVFFIERLRDEKAFASSEELARQIGKDVKRARALLGISALQSPRWGEPFPPDPRIQVTGNRRQVTGLKEEAFSVSFFREGRFKGGNPLSLGKKEGFPP